MRIHSSITAPKHLLFGGLPPVPNPLRHFKARSRSSRQSRRTDTIMPDQTQRRVVMKKSDEEIDREARSLIPSTRTEPLLSLSRN